MTVEIPRVMNGTTGSESVTQVQGDVTCCQCS